MEDRNTRLFLTHSLKLHCYFQLALFIRNADKNDKLLKRLLNRMFGAKLIKMRLSGKDNKLACKDYLRELEKIANMRDVMRFTVIGMSLTQPEFKRLISASK